MLATAGSASLLELDPDLGSGLDPVAWKSAEQILRVPLLRVEVNNRRGKWGDGSATLAGFLMVEGALLREVQTARRTTAELVGPGDIIRPFGEDGEEDLPVSAQICWRVVKPVTVAPIDGRLLQVASRWPELLAAVMARCVRRSQRLALNLSASHMVRIADRLLLLFWHLSEHWGRVTRDGIVIDLPLTHSQLALMVGSERPSVSTALGLLANDGLITRLPNKGWCLQGPIPEDIGEVLTKAGRLAGSAASAA